MRKKDSARARNSKGKTMWDQDSSAIAWLLQHDARAVDNKSNKIIDSFFSSIVKKYIILFIILIYLFNVSISCLLQTNMAFLH